MRIPFIKRKTFKYEILAIAVLFTITRVYFKEGGSENTFLLIAAILGIYMAINIWANDVANNMWPAVWAKAITLTWAIIIAAIFEASWAIIAWWDVVNTIKWWIINPDFIDDPKIFISIMMATLLWAALWINIATFFKAPVSATHSVIWWLVWSWITAYGLSVVTREKIWQIAASWVISPLMWWIIAATLLLSIRKTILKKEDRSEAAKIRVPVYVWIMSWSFTTYLLLKWLKRIIEISPSLAVLLWFVVATWVYVCMRIYLQKNSSILKNSKWFINKLFNIPLIFSVALLSFAHWANDVANAIWPLAAINDAIKNSVAEWKLNLDSVGIPFWIIFLWALWIVWWLSVFWARLIKTVWNEITKLNQIRAFSVALAAAITVIIASQLWLPVSSTHIAIGWVFGVWLIREYIKKVKWKQKTYIEKKMIMSIALARLITLPVSWIIASLVYLWVVKFV